MKQDNRKVAKELRQKGEDFRISLVKYVWDKRTTADDLRGLFHEILVLNCFTESTLNKMQEESDVKIRG